jgi:hypothetical protein
VTSHPSHAAVGGWSGQPERDDAESPQPGTAVELRDIEAGDDVELRPGSHHARAPYSRPNAVSSSLPCVKTRRSIDPLIETAVRPSSAIIGAIWIWARI